VHIQDLDPLNNRFLSTVLAAFPIVLLFYLLVSRRWLAPKAGLGASVAAIAIAWLVFKMPLPMASMAFVHGAFFGLLPVGWTVFCAMLIYNITVETGQFAIIRRSVASISGDARLQAVLIGFAFGAFLEGAAGGGSPVAICGAMLVGLGFHPFTAAVICLIANTSPVAYGGLGTPIITLQGVTDLSGDRLSVMAGRQLPILSCIVPFYMVRCMCNTRQTLEVAPALGVAGGSFGIFQFAFATGHVYFPKIVVWPMTDIGGGIFSLLVTALFLRYWKPKTIWTCDAAPAETTTAPAPEDAHAAEARESAKALLGSPAPDSATPLTLRTVTRAWMPFALMSVFLMVFGFVRQRESAQGPIPLGIVQSKYDVPVPTLHLNVERAPRLQRPGLKELEREKALFSVVWLTAPGTPVFLAAIVSVFYLRMTPAQVVRVYRRTFIQMKIPIPTIACMLGLSYVTRYAGMDATLGIAFAETGRLYPFFAAMLGWLGVFLTGTDAGSNALFGSLQKITATEIYNAGAFSSSGLDLTQAQVLICTANSTGGVMGKMIDAQSICVATAATNQLGREADILKAVLWHSIFLASIVGALTLIQAYVFPFTHMVP
jgi:lactate permease